MLLFVLGVALGVVGYSVLQHKSKYPEKSYVIAFMNTVLTPLRWLRIGPFKNGDPNMVTMMKVMSDELKLFDYGDMSFVTAYKAISDMPKFKEERMTNIGVMMATAEYRIMLQRRLKLIQFLKSNPSIESIPIRAPVFVFGLGRSGTTFLHRLLSLDPKVRSPRLWELVVPVPDLSLNDNSSAAALASDRQQRMEIVRKRIEERHVMGDDGLEKYHEVGYDLPEECLFGLADEIPTMFHYMFMSVTNWPEMRSKLPDEQFVRAYQWYKKILQTLSWQIGDRNNDQRWVLKCPLHIFMIPFLAKVFPDAKIVW